MYERKGFTKTVVVTSVITFLATIILLVGILQIMFLSNYQGLGNLKAVYDHIKSDGLQKVSTKSLVDGATKGMVSSLNDPYSVVYLDPKNYSDLNNKIKGTFGGVGVVVESKDNRVVVLSVIKGAPADKAGLKGGDTIIKIGDKETSGLDLDTVAEMIRGEVGTKVKLTIFRTGMKSPLEYVLERKVIEVPTVEGDLIKDTKVGLVTINSFNTRTGEELNKTLSDLEKKGARGIILDLRDNPGGELIAATEVADKLIPKGPIVYIDYRTQSDEVYNASGDNIKIPLVVLVNGGSASAAEIVAGAIKDTNAGVLVGTKTFGKGVVQTIIDLKDGSGLKLTTARYLTPKKHNINKVGITPNVVVEQPQNSDKDVQLDKAIQIIKGKM